MQAPCGKCGCNTLVVRKCRYEITESVVPLKVLFFTFKRNKTSSKWAFQGDPVKV